MIATINSGYSINNIGHLALVTDGSGFDAKQNLIFVSCVDKSGAFKSSHAPLHCTRTSQLQQVDSLLRPHRHSAARLSYEKTAEFT